MKPDNAILEAVINAVHIHSKTDFSWFGRREERLPVSLTRAIDNKAARSHLISQLQSRLYQSFYVFGYPRSVDRDDDASDSGGNPQFVQTLSAANCGEGSFSSGWTVLSVASGSATVESGGLQLTVNTADCMPQNKTSINVGDPVNIRFPKEQMGISPGYYMTLSNEEFTDSEKRLRIRVYWNVSPDGAGPLTGEITEKLNTLKVPFRFKILNNPAEFKRCDSAVLYFPKEDFSRVSNVISQIYQNISQWVIPGTTAFTKELATGLGLAEDPPDGTSFGMTRCQYLAEGLVKSHEKKITSIEKRIQVISDCFTEKDISFTTPFLNPGSMDVYAFSGGHTCRTKEGKPVVSPSSTPDKQQILDVAVDVAARLSESTYIHDKRCTWLARNQSNGRFRNSGQSNYELIGPTLYDGNAGVALFLSELGHITGNHQHQELAFCAIQQSISQLQDIPDSMRLGFYSGWLGIAYCAARIGKLHDNKSLTREARRLCDSVEKSIGTAVEFDTMGGLAGGILALLELQKILGEPEYHNLLIKMGDRLIALAEPFSSQISWAAPDQPAHQNNLTGYSHGTAGAAHALLELYAYTNRPEYRKFAEAAISYEQFCFSEQERNWPDYRVDEKSSKTEKQKPEFMCAWCHGAPGIAVSRTRAFLLLQDNQYKEQAVTALETTKEWLERSVLIENEDTCNCHGMLGNAEIYFSCTHALNGKIPQDPEFSDQLLQRIIDRYLRDHRSAREQVSFEGPGIMTGVSGTGYALIRRAYQNVPSILGTGLQD